MKMKLAIGSVQFGMDYGAGGGKKVPLTELAPLFDFARQAGIDLIDTAPRYGDSEALIGRIAAGTVFPRIVTKTPHFPGERIAPEQIDRMEAVFRRSMRQLRRAPLYAVLVHLAEDLLKPGAERIYERMIEWKAKGWVRKIGFSVYVGEEIDRVLERFSFDVVQLPINVLDQRLLAGGHLARAKAAGLEIQARSVFLQGVLLLEPARVPPGLGRYRPRLEALRRRWEALGLTPLEGAVRFIRSVPHIDDAIVGVHSLRQLREVHRAFASPLGGAAELSFFEPFALNEEIGLLDPRRW